MEKVYLKYIGDGGFLIGIPMRDLTKEESEKFGTNNLINSGLYELAEKPERKPTKKGDE